MRSSNIKFVLLLALILILVQQYTEKETAPQQPEVDQDVTEDDNPALESAAQAGGNVENVYAGTFFPVVAVALFTGPSIVDEFCFYQDA